MRLLQVCNVGTIVGGTAACAWTTARAFPDVEHHVLFLSPPTDECRRAFARATVHHQRRVTDELVRSISPDVMLLHNVSRERIWTRRLPYTIQYVHSAGVRAGADRTVYCSRWLAGECGADRANAVLYQAVPIPNSTVSRESDREDVIVGRLCTPIAAKWPSEQIAFYGALAERHSRVIWEFVGCPLAMRAAFSEACQDRCRFHEAGWSARSHLQRWDVLLYHHPTLTESFGRTVAEAMRAGCVPIVDGRGGFREQIPNDCGWLCDSIDEFDAALTVVSGPGDLTAFASRARWHADSTFSLAQFRRNFLRLIQ
jgi:hypothetical protein